MNLKCKQCGTEFTKRRIRMDDPKFCSRKCYITILRSAKSDTTTIAEACPEVKTWRWWSVLIIAVFVLISCLVMVRK